MSLQVKISHAADTRVFMASGLELTKSFLPIGVAVKFFIDKMVRRAVIDANPHARHKCTATCGRVASLVLKSKRKGALKDNLPTDLADFVTDFEDHLNVTLEHALGYQRVSAIAIMFVPCDKKLEILDSAIYL